jgi:hypothetical protein
MPAAYSPVRKRRCDLVLKLADWHLENGTSGNRYFGGQKTIEGGNDEGPERTAPAPRQAIFKTLVGFAVQLEVVLRLVADRTDFGGLVAFVDVATLFALP